MADIGIRSWSVRSNGNKMILKSICFSPESESIAKAEHAHDIRKYDMNVDVVPKLLMLIRQAVDEKASDVHLRADSAPRLRIDGDLYQVKGFVPSEEINKHMDRNVCQHAFEGFPRRGLLRSPVRHLADWRQLEGPVT